MVALVVVSTFVVLVLGVLVAGLLRSHADILRSLHELGVGVGDPASAVEGSGRPAAPAPAPAPVSMGPSAASPSLGEAPTVAGVTPAGDARRRRHGQQRPLHPAGIPLLGLRDLRRVLGGAAGAPGLDLPDGTRVVIVTKGPDREMPARCGARTTGRVPVVMSTEAWVDYEVPGSPFFVLVDGATGRKVGQGVAEHVAQLAELVRRAELDREPGTARGAVPTPVSLDGPAREAAADDVLRAAGIHPGRSRACTRGRSTTSSPSAPPPRRPPARPTGCRSHGLDGHHRCPRHRGAVCPRGSRGGSSCARRRCGSTYPVAQFATFPLPDDIGDFGSGAVNLMGSEDVFATLFEYGPESLGTALFARQGRPETFSPQRLLARSCCGAGLVGQSGTQWFFTEAGRPFSFYAVLGSHALRDRLVPRVNMLLASLALSPALAAGTAPAPRWDDRVELIGLYLIAAGLLVAAGIAKAVRPDDTARGPGGADPGRRAPSQRWLRGAVRTGALAEAAARPGGAGSAAPGHRGAGRASYASFAVVVAYARARGGTLATCGCFGRPDTPATVVHVAVDLVLAGAAAAVAAGAPSGGSIATLLAHQPGPGCRCSS